MGAERDGEHFVVSTREGATVLVRIEATGKIERAVGRRPHAGCGCTGTDDSSSTTASKPREPLNLETVLCEVICTDFTVDTGHSTEVHRICLPVNCFVVRLESL